MPCTVIAKVESCLGRSASMNIFADANPEQLGQLLGFVVIGGAVVLYLASRVFGERKQGTDKTEE